MSKFTLVVLCVVAVGLTNVSAITEEEKQALHAAVEPLVAECSKELGVSSDEIEAAKEAKNPDNLNKCFVGCLMKKGGIINEKGLYDVEAGLGKLKEYFKDTAQLEVIAKDCTKVNDESVSDGEAGCERAKLLMSCVLEHKAKLSL